MAQDEFKEIEDDDFLKPDSIVPGTEPNGESSSEPSIQEQPIEQVDSFETLTDMGMMEHKPTETFSDIPSPYEAAEEASVEELVEASQPTFAEETAVLENIREYSESTLAVSTEATISYPFHFYAEGKFGFFERDKLLRFITENPVGITSAEIDLQISSGKVFIPRISEFAGIKLIQELRDTPLRLKLIPSSREGDELIEKQSPIRIQYGADDASRKKSANSILVLDPKSPDRSSYQEFDQIQATQYLKAEIIEVEKSDLFQELLARMIESVKKKAELKGADAITQPVTQVLTLRLPSQYQIVLTTSLLKKKINA